MRDAEPLLAVRHVGLTLRPPPGLHHRMPGPFALRDISFTVRQGETVALLGPNGAGKTTLLRVLAQVYRCAAGQLQIRGRTSGVIGLVPAFSPELTVAEQLRAYAVASGTEVNIGAALEFAGLAPLARRPVRLLSTGERTRLAMTPGLLAPADLYLLDEALAACDSEFRATVVAALERRVTAGAAVILAGQDFLTARLVCRRGLLLVNGALVLDAELDVAITAFTTAVTHRPAERAPVRGVVPVIESVAVQSEMSDPSLVIPVRCGLRVSCIPFQVLVAVKDAAGVVVYSSRAIFRAPPEVDATGGVAVEVGIPAGCVPQGAYRVAVAVCDAQAMPLVVREDAAVLRIPQGVTTVDPPEASLAARDGSAALIGAP